MIIPILFFLGLTLFLHEGEAKTIRVAVIDTGKPYNSEVKLCPDGHKDFTDKGIEDHHGHSTNVSTIIHNIAKETDYCIIIIKVWEGSSGDLSANMIFNYTRSVHPDIINLSGGFIIPSVVDISNDLTKKSVIDILDSGIIFVNSAGNNGLNLDKQCVFYPACYDERIVVVGNLTPDGTRQEMSNYGMVTIDRWEMGTNIRTGMMYWTGTSQAAAVATGKIVLNLHKLVNLKPKEAR